MSRKQPFVDNEVPEEDYDDQEAPNENDPRDQQIADLERETTKLKQHFVDTIDILRKQLSDIVTESKSIQQEMFNRISELKTELKELRETRKSKPSNVTKDHIEQFGYDSVRHPRKLASQGKGTETVRQTQRLRK